MNYPNILLFILVCSCSVLYGRRHGSDIMQRPNDVIGTACGEEVKMTCVAKARSNTKDKQTPPDVEWWWRSPGSVTTSSEKIIELEREGRISIHVEEFVVVRSTLVVKDLQPDDEGIYQCRASKSPQRFKPGVNVYQHWKIEEAPISDLQCSKDLTGSSITHVIPTETNNTTKLEDIILSTILSSRMTLSKSIPVKAFTRENSPSGSTSSRGTQNRLPRSATVSFSTFTKASGISTHQNSCTAGVWFATVLCILLCLVTG